MINRDAAIIRLWHMGNLSWKLEPVQKDMYTSFYENKGKITTILSSRRLGKSYFLCALAIEQCLKFPNSLVKYLAPTQKNVRTIINPLIRELLEDCPLELKPEYKKNDGFYKFPNGSEIQLAGTDAGNAEVLRGGDSHLCIIDEAGFCDDLKYIIQSILIPTTTITKGKIVLSSTPPKTPGHEFVHYIERALEKGSLIKKTIYDGLGSRITPEIIQDILDELGGEDSPDFQREYLCAISRDMDNMVVPEFDDELEAVVVKEWPRPVFYDRYVAGDIGFKDLTVFLFAYYDFRAAKIIIEDEVVLKGMTTDEMALAIKNKEKELYFDAASREVKPAYLRVADNNLIVINDLHRLHNLHFIPTLKDDKEMAINNFKIFLKQGRIIINPKCKTLINHLKFGTWNKSRTSYTRKDGHHYDAIDSGIYLARSMILSKNPYPSNYGAGSSETWFDPKFNKENVSPEAQVFKKIFKIK